MDSSVDGQLQQLVNEYQNLNAKECFSRIESIRHILKKKLREAQTELRQIQYQFKLLKSTSNNDIDKVKKESDWARLYNAWAIYLEGMVESTQPLEGENTKDLTSFENEVSEKLSKQEKRLQKLKEYSEQLRSKYIANSTKPSHREQRILEAESVFESFQSKLKIEKERHYNSRIQAVKAEYARCSVAVSQLNNQISQISQQKADTDQECVRLQAEISVLESDISKRSKLNHELQTQLNTEIQERKQNIKKGKLQISQLETDLTNTEELLQQIYVILPQSQQGVHLAQNLSVLS